MSVRNNGPTRRILPRTPPQEPASTAGRPSITGRAAVTQKNIERAMDFVLDPGATKKQLEGAVAFLGKAQAMLRMATGPLSMQYPTVMNFRKAGEERLAGFVDQLESSTRTPRFVGLTAPTTIESELKGTSATDLRENRAAFNSNDTGMAILRRDRKNFVWTAYQPVPRMRRGMRAAASPGMVATNNSAGGLNLRAGGDKDIVGAKSVVSTLDAILPRGDARREKLAQGGFDLNTPMNMMVIKVEGQREPMVLIGGAGERPDPSGGRGIVPPWMQQPRDQQGVTVICSEVQFIPFKDQNGNPTGGGSMTMRKPVVYLYPEKIESVKVELAVDGELTTTYPRISKDGTWTVKAGPTGEIFEPTTEKRYPYLFWEARRNTRFTIDTAQAFCVSSKDAEKFLEDAAQKYALNEKERTDFVTYWLPALENNKYSLVQFLSEAEYDRYASMTITPKPDCVNRLFMIFQGVNTPVKTGNPALAQLDRKGFTVIEWGGTNLDE